MPWHRKTRCKSKDRGEQDYKGNPASSLVKQSALSASNAEMHSSSGSITTWDVALNKQVQLILSLQPGTITPIILLYNKEYFFHMPYYIH